LRFATQFAAQMAAHHFKNINLYKALGDINVSLAGLPLRHDIPTSI
jgi:hypothetical protein